MLIVLVKFLGYIPFPQTLIFFKLKNIIDKYGKIEVLHYYFVKLRRSLATICPFIIFLLF